MVSTYACVEVVLCETRIRTLKLTLRLEYMIYPYSIDLDASKFI